MYIRRTTIKSRRSGEPYFTYRLVESIREGNNVRQRTLLNLGRSFEVPRAQWKALARRIEQLVSGQHDMVPVDLDAHWEEAAQRHAAQLIRAKARLDEGRATEAADYQHVDVASLDVVRPRSVVVEHVALAALRQVGLDRKLDALGFNGPQRAAAMANIIARMAVPGSELATHHWLQHQSGLGELIEHDFTRMSLMALYRASDQLLKHKAALEEFLYTRERTLFEFDEVITLYDLTNTYFEGSARGNANAAEENPRRSARIAPWSPWRWCSTAVVFPSAVRSLPVMPASPRPSQRWWVRSPTARLTRPPPWCSMPALPPRRTSPGWSSMTIATWWSVASAIVSSIPIKRCSSRSKTTYRSRPSAG
jgi:hypothetical protein